MYLINNSIFRRSIEDIARVGGGHGHVARYRVVTVTDENHNMEVN